MLAEAKLTLTDLADQINEAHAQCQEAYRSSLHYARTAGNLLIEAKDQLSFHGEWQPWLKENVRFARRTAQAYMQVAKDWAVLEESAAIADLSFRDALRLLSQGEEAEPLILEAELVEEPPKPKPGKVEFLVGSKAKVASPDNLYNGQEVEIVERQADFCIGRTPQGKEYPFFSRELEPAEPVIHQLTPEPRPPQPSRLERFISLVRRILETVELPEELAEEARVMVGGDRQ